MNKKYQTLYSLINQAQADPKIKTLPNIQRVLSKARVSLENQENYTEISVFLSQAITKSYLASKQTPLALKTIFDYVKPDADPEKLDAKTKRKMGIISGYVRSPLNQGSIFN